MKIYGLFQKLQKCPIFSSVKKKLNNNSLKIKLVMPSSFNNKKLKVTDTSQNQNAKLFSDNITRSRKIEL